MSWFGPRLSPEFLLPPDLGFDHSAENYKYSKNFLIAVPNSRIGSLVYCALAKLIHPASAKALREDRFRI